MDSDRNRNLKELRQKRLQYFEKKAQHGPTWLTSASLAKNQSTFSFSHRHSTITLANCKATQNNQNKTSSQIHSILAWETEKKSAAQHNKRSSRLDSSVFESRLEGGLHMKSDLDRKAASGEEYVSPLISLKQAQASAFSTARAQSVLPNGFKYLSKDFRPVDRDKIFSTKPIEDLTWTSATSTDRKSSGESGMTSSQLLDSEKKAVNTSYGAFCVENVMQEMAHVRKLRACMHNELKLNFDRGSSSSNRCIRLDKCSDVSLTSSNDNATEVHGDGNQSKNPAISLKDSDPVTTLDTTSKIAQDISFNSSKRMEEDMEEDGFNLSALQDAAKQGDDVLRKYIKSISQRPNDYNDKIDDGEEIEAAHQDSVGTYESLNGLVKSKDVDNKTNDGKNSNVHVEELKGVESYLNESISTCVNSLQIEQILDTDIGSVEEKEDNMKYEAHSTPIIEPDSDVPMTSGNHQPIVVQPTITSTHLHELELLEDILSTKTSQNSSLHGKKHSLIEDKVIDTNEEIRNIQESSIKEANLEDGEDIPCLITHRPKERPISPLKNIQIGATHIEPSKCDFLYIHIPSAGDSAILPSESNEVNMTSNGSDVVEKTYLIQRNRCPKPPDSQKKSASRKNSYGKHINQSSSTSIANTTSNSKRPKTPERHICGVREHHQKDRETRKCSPKLMHKCRESSSPKRNAKQDDKHNKAYVKAECGKPSVLNSTFQRGVLPEAEASISIPILNLHDKNMLCSDDGKDNARDIQDPEWFESSDQLTNHQDNDNESLLMQKIADFQPHIPFSKVHHVGGSGDAPYVKKASGLHSMNHTQLPFQPPYQTAVNNLLDKSSESKESKSLPAVRPSSAGPQRSKVSGVQPSKLRPSSAKSKISQYLNRNIQYRRKWATSTSLWGSRPSSSAAGDLQLADQQSRLTDPPKSPKIVRKLRPTSASERSKLGSKSQRSKPCSASASVYASRQKEDFLNIDSAQLTGSLGVRLFNNHAQKAVPPLTKQLIVDSPRSSEGLSLWQLVPDEILLHIFSCLDHYQLVQCAQTCTLFNRVALDESLWRHIQLKKRALTDFWLTQIGERHPTNLELVECYGNVTENGLRNLFRSCADNLKELNVSGCSTGELSGDSLLLHASRCSTLTSLDASWCNVTDNGLNAINDSVYQLSSLCLNGCREVSDHCLNAFISKHGKSLTVLEVFGCFNLSVDTLRLVGDECKHLKTLNVGQCYKLTDESIAKLAPHLKGVSHLDMRGCKQVRDGCIRKLVRHCKKMENLVLANCTHISNTALTEIATYLPSIKHLDMAGCKRVTNEGVRALATNCHQLTTLDISSTGIDHRSVASLASYCNKSLRGLKLNCCKDITEASIVKLLRHCRALETVHLYGVKGLRTLGILKLQYACLMYEAK